MMTQFLLIGGIIALFMILYLSIVPCQQNNNTTNSNTNSNTNNSNKNIEENFELPDQISQLIDKRTNMLKNHSISINVFQSAIDDAIGEIHKLKDKVKLLHDESDNVNNSILMFNTNGQITQI
jgi:hypothetical protein